MAEASFNYRLTKMWRDYSTLLWIQNFLTTRTQKVVVDGSFSDIAHVGSGVPQGTVLSPILFLCYINDLPSSVSSDVRLFADDCRLYRPIRTKADLKKTAGAPN